MKPHHRRSVIGRQFEYWSSNDHRHRVVAGEAGSCLQDCHPRQQMVTQRRFLRKASMKKLAVKKDKRAQLKRLTQTEIAERMERALFGDEA